MSVGFLRFSVCVPNVSGGAPSKGKRAWLRAEGRGYRTKTYMVVVWGVSPGKSRRMKGLSPDMSLALDRQRESGQEYLGLERPLTTP